MLSPTGKTSIQGSTVKNLVKDLGEKLNINGEEFLKEDFDVKTFSSALMKTSQLSEHLGNLAQNIQSLDKEIKEQVSMHHEDLLHQAVNIETLEEMLDMVQTRISSLKSTSERLRLKINTPFNELNLRILQLSRLQSACDTLRRIKGILFHSSKLRLHMQAGVKDIVKSAQSLNELDFLLKNFDSTGIEIIENDVHFAFKSRREVEEQAQVILEKSMQHQDQTQMGTALQVFYSLGVLNQKLIDCLKWNEKNFQKFSTELLDSTNLTLQSTSSSASLQTSASAMFLSPTSQFPGRSTMPNVGSMSQFRAQLWTNVEKLMDSLYDSCAQIYQLQQILEKKKDILSNLLYIDEIDFSLLFNSKMFLSKLGDSVDSGQIIITYESICSIIDSNEINARKSIEFLYEQWRCLANVLNAAIVSACNQSNYIKQTFQNEYPKLLKLQNDLWLRLLQLNPLIDRYRYINNQVLDTSKQNTKQSVNYLSSYELLRKCFYDLENSFLNRSLSHLFDPINLIFSQSSDKQINRADIDTYLKGVQSQLQTLQYDIFNSPSTALQTISKAQNTNLTFSGCSSAFSDKIVANVCKSIQMYANKAEQLLNTLNSDLQQSINNTVNSSTSSGVITIGGSIRSNIFSFSSGLPYQIQMKNLDYVNTTHDLYEQMSKMFSNEKLSTKLEDKLTSALKSLLAFEENALQPFVLSASDCILAIMLTMHQEDFANPQSQTCSLYVKELQQVLQRISRDYLQLYNCKSILCVYLNQLAIRCIDLFIRNASILRPMSDAARQRLLNDSQHIELVVQNFLCNKLTDLGANYKHLKAFRHLLQTSSPFRPSEPSSLGADIVDEAHYSNILSESLPYHVLLHYLFSYAPVDFKSPHQSLDWPILRYSEWLDKHTNEKERLLVIKTCLETYVNTVRQKKRKPLPLFIHLCFVYLKKAYRPF